ncbi:DUF192 domain-containing protein [Rhizorhabdus argentea]|uniref:DUF192 domain-containing protein n=1 Tax=Rhizorhabdus argentea TaxID=1387174 RepID=UPI0030EBBABE
MRLLGVLALAALAGCTPGAARSADTPAAASSGGALLAPLAIKTARGVVEFRVEVANTPDQQSRGLMYRTSLPHHGGMIFPMAPPRFAAFWMKNTYIPLDMIFIRPDGTIARIAANTVPESLETIESGEPVSAVLEIVGGGAAADGIAEGDKVSWKTR